uniref:RING-type domain-containing protein n=1 Tax=Biomphalaria glabrata TaxID=6526 RepID=A0A2C9KEX8_BIOGL
MSSFKKLFVVLGRLPLLFGVDCTLKRIFINVNLLDLMRHHASTSRDYHELYATENVMPDYVPSFLSLFLWTALLLTITLLLVILICSPIDSILEVYGCLLGFGLLAFSFQCNYGLVNRKEYLLLFHESSKNNATTNENQATTMLSTPSIIISILTQLFIVLSLDQICAVGLRKVCKDLVVRTDIALFISLSFPIFLHAFLDNTTDVYMWSPFISLILPLILLAIHSFSVVSTLLSLIIPPVRDIKQHIREMGLDGVLLRVMEKANLVWLLRVFFFTKVSYSILVSKVLRECTSFENLTWSEVCHVFCLLALEVLHNMCETILSVMSMASIISVISGWCLRLIYHIVGAYDEEESLQPAVSGFLFVLLAMQTGITSITNEARLQLLFQNCVLLLVANQHFIQTVAADLLLKASSEDVVVKKHVRPMLPYLLFFSFPFIVVLRLWQYPFRLSWLLAISAFSLELIIKSIMSLSVYTLNMLHSHTQYFQETIEDCIFYVKAVCGSLEFICGIFLFLNGAYIFLFESGGIIRFVMMMIHLYCNIYQTAVKALATYRLRQSAWQKVNHLKAASQEQLDENNDICPICYQEMKEAVVIQCSHVFHKHCLQKWLFIQETCPLCHTDLRVDAPAQSNNTQGGLAR